MWTYLWGRAPFNSLHKTVQECSLYFNNIFNIFQIQFSSVQSFSCVRLFATPWTSAHQASLSITNSRSLTQIHVHWDGDAIQPCHPLSSPSPPECWALSQLFHSPLSLSSRGSLVLIHFLPEDLCHLHIWGYWYFSWQSWFQLMLLPAHRFSWCTLRRS